MRIQSLFFTIAVWICLAVPSSPAFGQAGPFAFQIRSGFTRPLAGFRDPLHGWEGGSKAGPTLGMGFTFPLYRGIGGYMGFSQHRFGCDEAVCPEGKYWTDTGFDLAIRVVMGKGALRSWVQGGLHTHRMEGKITGADGAERLKSEGGGGYEVGGGFLLSIGERTSLAPGVRYGLGNVPFDNLPTLGVRFLVFDIGLVLGF